MPHIRNPETLKIEKWVGKWKWLECDPGDYFKTKPNKFHPCKYIKSNQTEGSVRQYLGEHKYLEM